MSRERQVTDILKERVPQSIAELIVFDSGDETLDRYTVFIHDENGWKTYAMGKKALWPLGVNQFVGEQLTPKNFAEENKARQVEMENLPNKVIKAIQMRMTANQIDR
jgi:hypothetical protein